jgi:hypothetical protein
MLTQRKVIKADDTDVFRNAIPQFLTAGHDALGVEVMAADNGRAVVVEQAGKVECQAAG